MMRSRPDTDPALEAVSELFDEWSSFTTRRSGDPGSSDDVSISSTALDQFTAGASSPPPPPPPPISSSSSSVSALFSKRKRPDAADKSDKVVAPATNSCKRRKLPVMPTIATIRRRERPVCLFVNYLGTRLPQQPTVVTSTATLKQQIPYPTSKPTDPPMVAPDPKKSATRKTARRNTKARGSSLVSKGSHVEDTPSDLPTKTTIR